MRRTPVIVVAAFAMSACGQVSANVPSTELLANLPVDSIVRSLGPQFAAKGIAVGAGHNNDISVGRFETTYLVEFAAQQADAHVIDQLAAKLRDVALQKGRVVGESSDGETHHSFKVIADGVTGWLGVVAARPRTADLDRYLIITTEVHEPKR